MGSAVTAGRGSSSRTKAKTAVEPSVVEGKDWRPVFLAVLADTSNVTASAKEAGVATSTVYDLRRKDAEFNREWQVALCEGYDNLEMEVLERLRKGELKPLPGAKRNIRSFDNGAAMRLLAAHRESTARERAFRQFTSVAEVRASIERRVERLREKVMAAQSSPQLPAPDNG